MFLKELPNRIAVVVNYGVFTGQLVLEYEQPIIPEDCYSQSKMKRLSMTASITSKEIFQIPLSQDFLHTLHDVEHTWERHSVSPHLVLSRVFVRNKRTPIFFKALERSTFGWR